MALEQENAYFEAHKSGLLAHHKGELALVRGHELIGTFARFQDAYSAGFSKFGNTPFLIKAIEEDGDRMQFPALVVGMISARP
jgi:hypothetical protein